MTNTDAGECYGSCCIGPVGPELSYLNSEPYKALIQRLFLNNTYLIKTPFSQLPRLFFFSSLCTNLIIQLA